MHSPITISHELASVIAAATLTGFNAANTDCGRLFAATEIADSNITLTLYRHPSCASADAVASGTASITANSITLTQANSSGLSGSVELLAVADVSGVLSVSFALRADLDERVSDLDALLDESSEFAGLPDFEGPLLRAKREIDRVISARLRRKGYSRDQARTALATILPSEGLRRAATCFALAAIFERLSNDPGDAMQQRAYHFQSLYRDALASAEIELQAPGASSATERVSIGDYAFLLG